MKWPILLNAYVLIRIQQQEQDWVKEDQREPPGNCVCPKTKGKFVLRDSLEIYFSLEIVKHLMFSDLHVSQLQGAKSIAPSV